jgi:hypothetical protein
MQGTREYTYRRKSSLFASVGLSLFMTGFLIFWMVGWTNQELREGRAPILGLVFTAPFWLVCAYLYRQVFVWINEKVILTDREVMWIDALGRERLRRPLTSIRRLSFKIGGGSDNAVTVGIVETDAGTFKFTSSISRFRELCARLDELARPP